MSDSRQTASGVSSVAATNAGAAGGKILPVVVSGGQINVHLYEPKGTAAPSLTLLCLHGWTLDHRSFEQQYRLVDSGIRVASFDRRGFGKTTLSPNFSTEMGDLDAIVDALARETDGDVILYGVSQGARLALRYVVYHPGKARGLVVQGGHLDGLAVHDTVGEAIPFDQYRQWLQAGDLESFRADWLAHPLVALGNEDCPEQYLASLIECYDGRDLLLPGALPQIADIRDDLSGMALPTLVLTGSLETESRQRHAHEIARLLKGREIPIEGGGHLCNISHWQAVNAALLVFLHSLN